MRTPTAATLPVAFHSAPTNRRKYGIGRVAGPGPPRSSAAAYRCVCISLSAPRRIDASPAHYRSAGLRLVTHHPELLLQPPRHPFHLWVYVSGHLGALMQTEPVPIHSDPGIIGDTTVFVRTRIPVQTFVEYLEAGDPLDAFLTDFPVCPGRKPLPSCIRNFNSEYHAPKNDPPPRRLGHSWCRLRVIRFVRLAVVHWPSRAGTFCRSLGAVDPVVRVGCAAHVWSAR